jgi:hypothetical protein
MQTLSCGIVTDSVIVVDMMNCRCATVFKCV